MAYLLAFVIGWLLDPFAAEECGGQASIENVEEYTSMLQSRKLQKGRAMRVNVHSVQYQPSNSSTAASLLKVENKACTARIARMLGPIPDVFHHSFGETEFCANIEVTLPAGQTVSEVGCTDQAIPAGHCLVAECDSIDPRNISLQPWHDLHEIDCTEDLLLVHVPAVDVNNIEDITHEVLQLLKEQSATQRIATIGAGGKMVREHLQVLHKNEINLVSLRGRWPWRRVDYHGIVRQACREYAPARCCGFVNGILSDARYPGEWNMFVRDFPYRSTYYHHANLYPEECLEFFRVLIDFVESNDGPGGPWNVRVDFNS